MSTYITVYVVLSVLLILLINLQLMKRGKKRSKKQKSSFEATQAEHLRVKLDEAQNEFPKRPEVKRNVEEDVTPKRTEKPIETSRVEDAKESTGKGKVLAALMLGAFVAILNQTLLNVAIPHIMTDLNVSASTVQWLSTGYMLVNGIFIPVTAFLIDKFGTRKLFLTSIFLFTFGSVICSLSTNFSFLMTGRLIQASGAGIIMPLLMTVFFTIFPPEKRGTAMGIMGVVMLFAPAIGPTLSGWLIEHYSWRLLFDIVIPIGIIDLILSYLWVKDVTEKTNPKFDFPGLLFSTVGFGFLLYGFSEAGSDGWSSTTVVVSLLIGIISLVAFTIRELTTDKPMLDLRVFKYDIFSLTTVISMIINMAMFGAMILLPIYLQNIRGFTALDSGLLLLPGAIVMGIMTPIAGALFDKIGARWLAVIGLLITIVTTWEFTKLSMTTSYDHIMFLYIMRMFGMSFLSMTVMTEGLNQLPPHLGSHGTAASNTARQVAGSIGTAFLVTVMTTRQSAHMGEYSSLITSANPFIATKTAQIGQGLATVAHVPATVGNQLSSYLIYGQTMKQATIDGINDSFMVATGIAVVAFCLAFFIKRSRPKAQ
ncbi:DHA2 family efflux MFS transporter permease subunit [Neobacillus sp. LXY-1]|uniref:DHA2 family efflux MFS transporter permease subunit n=1 Tax=Neobacillus sp. LXY-1 TaxID=3379133 RepID=UPI003EDF84BE